MRHVVEADRSIDEFVAFAVGTGGGPDPAESIQSACEESNVSTAAGQRRSAVFLFGDSLVIDDIEVQKSADRIPDTIDALKRLSQRFLLFVVTTQKRSSDGNSISKNEGNSLRLHRILAKYDVTIQEWYVCPDDCIPSNPAFLPEAEKSYGVDISRSFVIGNHPQDVAMGQELGCYGLYLMTGCGSEHLDEVPMDNLVFHSLRDALSWIDTHPQREESLREEIRKGVDAIRAGGLTVFPTETVYGLGADALNAEAVVKIFEAKERPFQDPLISHVCDRAQVVPMVSELPERAVKLMDAFWPGPLTLVLPKSRIVPDVVTGGNPTVAVRMPRHPLALELIRQAGTPIAAPSANTFGKTSPTTAQHVKDQLAGKFDAIIDGGACRVGVESTVLSLVGDVPVLLRPGGVTIEEIESVIGKISVKAPERELVFDSPGMFPSHYAPVTPMIMVDDPSVYAHETNVAIMLFKPSEVEYAGTVFVLSQDGDARSAAAKLYQTMRRIDELHYRLIIAQRLPDSGLGIAVNDRMSRAAAK
jgi:L-threonylcarbamoyladenylate synthase